VSSGIVLGATNVSAQEGSSNPMSSLVSKIAQRFNLNESEVQAVFDEHHNEMHEQMQSNFEDRLSQLVLEGKITEAQKAAIVAKMEELHANKEAWISDFENLTPEERRAKMLEKRAELEAWAAEQGIDLSVIGPLKFGHHRGGGMMFHKIVM